MFELWCVREQIEKRIGVVKVKRLIMALEENDGYCTYVQRLNDDTELVNLRLKPISIEQEPNCLLINSVDAQIGVTTNYKELIYEPEDNCFCFVYDFATIEIML